jgi:imidazolonepropionase
MKLRGLGYMEILKKGGGILKTVRATRAASVEQIVKETRPRLLSMLSHGTTTVEVKTGYGLDLDSELKLLEAAKELQLSFPGKIVQTFLGAHALPPEFDSATIYTDFIVERMLPSVADTKLAEFCDVFCEPDVFGIQDAKRILENAHALGMHLKIHADEFQRTGATTLAVELGATSADHLLQSTDQDIALLSKSNTVATFLPSTPFCSLLDNYANARRFIDSGCAVALASDISPNAWCESMQLVIQLAVLKMRVRVHEAIVAATINGAHAIRKAKEVGSLEVGKRANALVMDVPNHKFLAYELGTNLSDVVITNGKVVARGGKLAA